MKKLLNYIIFAAVILSTGCAGGKIGSRLTSADYANAIKEALSIGTQYGGLVLGKKGSLDKNQLLAAILPENLQRVTSVLSTLGLSSEVDKFSSTLTDAASETVEKSLPIFLSGIKGMKIKDAAKIVAGGNGAATNYLRLSIGDSLRSAITPVMNTALDKYNLTSQWNKLIAPAQLLLGGRLNLDIGNLMAGFVTNAMFNKIEQKEADIRINASARSSVLLQRVFGGLIK